MTKKSLLLFASGLFSLMVASVLPTFVSATTTLPGEFMQLSYKNHIGSRQYRLYLPSNYAHTTRTLPLIIMLHGCTQSAEDFALGTRMNVLAEEMGFVVAYPEQSQSANDSKCWNWFLPEDQVREKGEPSLIAGITQHLLEHYKLDKTRVYVAGFSAGGAAAAVLRRAYPDLYTAIGIHSGLPCGAANDLNSALLAMKKGTAPSDCAAPNLPTSRMVPTILFHGNRDTLVHVKNSEHLINQVRTDIKENYATHTEKGKAPGGHHYYRHIYTAKNGPVLLEQWIVQGGKHTWFGGDASGSHTDPKGPDASKEMVRFFLEHAME